MSQQQDRTSNSHNCYAYGCLLSSSIQVSNDCMCTRVWAFPLSNFSSSFLSAASLNKSHPVDVG